MSNLIRGRQDYLMNIVTGAEVGSYVDSSGIKHLVLKKIGLDIPNNNGTKVSILRGGLGTKKKITLTPVFVSNGSSYVFTIHVTKLPKYSGFTHEQFPITHSYQYEIKSFDTASGLINNTDKDALINGLIANINADVRRAPNAVSTGAFVTCTAVNHTLVLESKEYDVDFVVSFDAAEFTQTLTTAFRKSRLTNDDVWRIFVPKGYNEGMRQDQAMEGVTYCIVKIEMKTAGYDNVVASGDLNRNQAIYLYMPLTALTATTFASPANMGTNTATMSDNPTAAISLLTLLETVFDDVDVTPDIVSAAIGGVTAPVKNATPVSTVTETSEYTGTVAWFKTSDGTPLLGKFAASTGYTAVITLNIKSGTTLKGVTANYFTVAGATTVTNDAESNVITAVFPATEE